MPATGPNKRSSDQRSVFDRLGPRLIDPKYQSESSKDTQFKDRPRSQLQGTTLPPSTLKPRRSGSQSAQNPSPRKGPSSSYSKRSFTQDTDDDPWRVRWLAEKELATARAAVRRREPGAVDRLVQAELALDKILGLDILSTPKPQRKREGPSDGIVHVNSAAENCYAAAEGAEDTYASVTAFGGRRYRRSVSRQEDVKENGDEILSLQTSSIGSEESSDPQRIIKDLRSRIAALEDERMQAEELANALLASRQEALAEKAKVQAEKDTLVRENTALSEQVHFLQMSIASADGGAAAFDETLMSPSCVGGGLDYETGEQPITPDSGMLRALEMMAIEGTVVAGGEGDGYRSSEPPYGPVRRSPMAEVVAKLDMDPAAPSPSSRDDS